MQPQRLFGQLNKRGALQDQIGWRTRTVLVQISFKLFVYRHRFFVFCEINNKEHSTGREALVAFSFFLASSVWPLDLKNVILKITLRRNCVFWKLGRVYIPLSVFLVFFRGARRISRNEKARVSWTYMGERVNIRFWTRTDGLRTSIVERLRQVGLSNTG